jgi:hypothetical protein
LILPSTTSKIFETFICIDVDSEKYLLADLSIKCYTQFWYNGVIYASFMILVYPIGIPIMYLLMLYRVKDEIQHAIHDIEDSELQSVNNDTTSQIVSNINNDNNDHESIQLVGKRNNSIHKSSFDIPVTTYDSDNNNDNNNKKQGSENDECNETLDNNIEHIMINRKSTNKSINTNNDEHDDDKTKSNVAHMMMIMKSTKPKKSSHKKNQLVKNQKQTSLGDIDLADISSTLKLQHNLADDNDKDNSHIVDQKSINSTRAKSILFSDELLEEGEEVEGNKESDKNSKYIHHDDNSDYQQHLHHHHHHHHRKNTFDDENNNNSNINVSRDNSQSIISELTLGVHQRIVFASYEVKILRFLWEPYQEQYW